MLGQMKIFHVGSHQFRESLRELLRELRFLYCSLSRGMPFREWNFVFREWNFEFRELLREYPGTLRELREWPFHSESVFPEIGVVPRLSSFSNLWVAKGPCRTKNSTASKLATGRKNRYGNSKTLRRVLRSACFCRERTLIFFAVLEKQGKTHKNSKDSFSRANP